MVCMFEKLSNDELRLIVHKKEIISNSDLIKMSWAPLRNTKSLLSGCNFLLNSNQIILNSTKLLSVTNLSVITRMCEVFELKFKRYVRVIVF